MIPTREEHQKRIRRIWVRCLIAAGFVFSATGGTILVLFLRGADQRNVVNVSTAVFQICALAYALGFFVPAMVTGIEMNRRGLEIAEETAKHIDRLQTDLSATLKDLSAAILRLDDLAKKAEKKNVADMIDKI